MDSLDVAGLPREYIVKHFRSDQRLARITEYVAGRFAYDTQINAPEPVIVEFTPAFLADLASLPTPPRDVARAEPGLHVAFEWNQYAVCMMETHGSLNSLERPEQVGEIIGVDTVLINFDRSPANILVELLTVGRGTPAHVLHPIDWDLSFAGGIYDFSELTREGLLSSQKPWTDSGKVVHDALSTRVRSVDDLRSAISKLRLWENARARIQLVIKGMPREWAVTAEQQAALVQFFLRRVASTIAGLQAPDDPNRAFPNWQASLPLDSTA
ncbi:MAG: hypothetical protein H0T48_09390 [Gemmatimonadaceae bacterium]|nr:hypothetical protein [Gemmatimonadaceae bacterium]